MEKLMPRSCVLISFEFLNSFLFVWPPPAEPQNIKLVFLFGTFSSVLAQCGEVPCSAPRKPINGLLFCCWRNCHTHMSTRTKQILVFITRNGVHCHRWCWWWWRPSSVWHCGITEKSRRKRTWDMTTLCHDGRRPAQTFYLFAKWMSSGCMLYVMCEAPAPWLPAPWPVNSIFRGNKNDLFIIFSRAVFDCGGWVDGRQRQSICVNCSTSTHYDSKSSRIPGTRLNSHPWRACSTLHWEEWSSRIYVARQLDYI